MNKYRIINGTVFHEDGGFFPETVYVCEDRIVPEDAYFASDARETVVDACGNYVIPGLIDIHFHGCMGSDCCDGTEEALRVITEYELRQGVTAITPATMTVSESLLTRICQVADHFSNPNGADFLGLYLEGPFISHAKKGAQNEAYIRRADLDLLERLQALSGGCIRTVAIAPETEGALEFIRASSDRVHISLAHTTADYDTAREAFACGAAQLTHTYNAMPPFSHRAPGPIGAAVENEHCMAELICDGIHIHPAVVRATFRMFSDDRIILISDSIRATGLSDGNYNLGGQNVTVNGHYATLCDGTLAGSVTNLMGCVRVAVRDMGIPLESAVKCASVNPAKAVGVYPDYGTLAQNAYANIVILTQELALHTIFHRGNPL